MAKETLTTYKNFKPVFLNEAQVKEEISTVVSQLKAARLFRGLSMAKVCQDLKIPQSTISKDEKGDKNISLAKLIKYSAYYQVKFTV